MKNKFLIYILGYFQILSFILTVSFLLLFYLVVSDAYFLNLDFKLEGFNKKIDAYLMFTLNVPLILTIIYWIYLIFKGKSKFERIISGLLGIVSFIILNTFIKQIFIVYNHVWISLLIANIVLIFVFFISKKLKNKFSNTGSV